MALSVKNKIRLGTLFLFLLLLVAGGLGIYSTAILKRDARQVLKNNYESLTYCHDIQQQLDSLEFTPVKRLANIDSILDLQEANITEQGEADATAKLRSTFSVIKAGDTSRLSIAIAKNELHQVLSLNMEAMYKKNVKAERTAERAMTYLVGLAGIIILVSFTFSVNFPSIVADPIRQLSEAINEIANKNYKHRIYLNNNDEFGKLADAYNNMAERLQYFESSNLNKLMFEKSRAEAVINSLKDASIGIDGNNIVLFANYQALQLLGLKSADIVGKALDEIATRNDLFRHLVTNESSAPFKIIVDNRENYFIKETIEVKQGDTGSKVIVLRNITSFKELDVAKTNFIATISHELKTPLAASDFSLKLLEDKRIGELSSEQLELVQNLKQDNQRILKIVSELLNLSQVETGKIQLDIKAISPQVIVEKAVEAAQSAIREKSIAIQLHIDANLPDVKADADKTTWVLNNLLSNAIKHAPKESAIAIYCAVGLNEVIITVEDNGPGVAEEYIPRLFDRYFQVPGSNAKGTGLGLTISKEFMESQNGKIWVDSAVGKGSKFSISIPVSQTL